MQAVCRSLGDDIPSWSYSVCTMHIIEHNANIPLSLGMDVPTSLGTTCKESAIK